MRSFGLDFIWVLWLQKFKLFVNLSIIMEESSTSVTALSSGLMGSLAFMFQAAIVRTRIKEQILVGAGNSKRMEMLRGGYETILVFVTILN